MPPAARVTDMHVCPMVTPGVPPIPHVGGPILPPGVPTVLIAFLPAATVTNMATCVGPPDVIVKGSAGVFINFLPAARLGDQTAHGGVIVMGAPTVMIGEIGSPSPGAGGLGGIVAGLVAGGVSQLQSTPSDYSTPGRGGGTSPDASNLQNSEFNGVKADRVRPGTNDKVAVIGRSMRDAVNPYTEGLEKASDVETFSGDKVSPGALAEWNSLKKQYAPDLIPEDAVRKSLMFKENEAWAQKLADEGYTVVDVDNPTNEKASPFYEMEKQILFGGDSNAGAK